MNAGNGNKVIHNTTLHYEFKIVLGQIYYLL